MRVIARRTLREFWERHPDAKETLDAWYADTERASWKSLSDIRARCPNVAFLGTGIPASILIQPYALATNTGRRKHGGFKQAEALASVS